MEVGFLPVLIHDFIPSLEIVMGDKWRKTRLVELQCRRLELNIDAEVDVWMGELVKRIQEMEKHCNVVVTIPHHANTKPTRKLKTAFQCYDHPRLVSLPWTLYMKFHADSNDG